MHCIDQKQLRPPANISIGLTTSILDNPADFSDTSSLVAVILCINKMIEIAVAIGITRCNTAGMIDTSMLAKYENSIPLSNISLITLTDLTIHAIAKSPMIVVIHTESRLEMMYLE